jgi:hypothetical protein
VADTAPGDVVLFVAGSWEVQDVLRDGRWTNIEQPADQRYLLGQMRQAVEIGTAHGAHFDFTTMPALAAGAAFHEAPLPEDSPSRRLIYDRLIKEVAAEFPGKASVIDYGSILSPGGVFTQSIDGVQVRTSDGVHTPAYAPGNVFAGNSTAAVAHAFYNWISPRIWPLIVASDPVHQSSVAPGLTAAQHEALTAAGAFTVNPIRFALFGDSVALTLGVGLNVDAQSSYGVLIQDGAILGCDLDNTEVNLSGVVGPATQGCLGWRTRFPKLMARYHPEVTGLLLGRWEVSDHLYQGHWVHVGDAVWDRHLTAELDQAVDILSSGGARVILFTMPYVDPPEESANGTSFSENDPARMRSFNQIVTNVADSRKGVVTLVDLNALLDPAGHYQAVVDGVTVRNTDGIHLTKAAGEWLQPVIMPVVGTLGLQARAS